MAKEIERKFLVRDKRFLTMACAHQHIEQGYLSAGSPTVRIRIKDDEAFITIKGPSDPTGLSRDEWEYRITLDDAQELLSLCAGRRIVKDRYLVPHAHHTWEVDCFHGAHEGLIIAEVELKTSDEVIEYPDWLGEEVTGDPRYYNAYLAALPQR